MTSLYWSAYIRLCSGKPYGIESTRKLAEGVEFALGSREIEVDHQLSRTDFLSGKCFGRGGGPDTSTATNSRPSAAKQFVPLRPKTLNGGRTTVHTTPAATEKERSGINLEPVNLVTSQKAAQKSPARDSYWTANW